MSCSTNNVAEKSDLNIVLLVSNVLRLRTFSSLSSSDAICQVETHTNVSVPTVYLHVPLNFLIIIVMNKINSDFLALKKGSLTTIPLICQ